MSNPLSRIPIATILILNVIVGCVFVRAQQEGSSEIPTATLRAETRLVVVDAVVTDKKGQPVTGLQADDFTVEENGKKQKISVLVPPRADNTRSLTQVPPGVLSNHPEHVSPSGPPTVLILDVLNSQFKDQAYVRSQMLKYVTEQIQVGHPMAILTLTNRLHVIQEFTSDPQVLLAAIKDFRPQPPVLQAAPPPPATEASPSTGVRGGQAASLLAAARTDVAEFADQQVGYDLERRTLITIDAMNLLAHMLGGLQGRKSVVWMTSDLPFDLIPENRNVTNQELMATLPGQGSERSATVNAAGSLAAEARQLHDHEIKDAEARLATADIAIYPVDLRGLVGGMDSSAAYPASYNNDMNGAGIANTALKQSGGLSASQDTLQEVASETGGKAYFNENEVRQGVSLAVTDDKSSYTIGYYPKNKNWDGKYRKVRIKVARSGTIVRCRRGYFAIDTTQEKPNYDQDVIATLNFNAPATQVSFMVQLKTETPGKVQAVFLIDAHTITIEESGRGQKINVSLYATVFGSTGDMLASHVIKVDQLVDSDSYLQIVSRGMMVPIDIEVPRGSKEIRLAVVDNKTGLVGTVSGSLEIN